MELLKRSPPGMIPEKRKRGAPSKGHASGYTAILPWEFSFGEGFAGFCVCWGLALLEAARRL
jgi:hypothetical protein